ncbi:MAG: hypothetical protein LKJ18_02020 [Ancrocorticia sp.]|jgi:hypothetical protein|nr:hypothetical protein [Ancrocorticia sp.]MCI1962916.1 hypothetical protein [Ancrocorticia sp.]MCI2001804.1 hypothetical protein [Ancrocorticia sp.]MCI2001857.1 hypothetical protein [Ancrocorticia sp.]
MTATLGLPVAGATDPTSQEALYDTPRGWMDVIRALIEDSIVTAPRSLQKSIGPSEIGNPCDHCLAARLAGWVKNEHGVAWLPFIGTCVHEHFERFFARLSEAGTLDSLQEARVTVGQIGGRDVTGSTDLYLPDEGGNPVMTGMTVDWKIVGKSKLDLVKAHQHPGKQYEVQAHLYAKGWNDAGHPTSHVCVYFMPRNATSLDQGYVWIAKYDPGIAQAALDRANQINDTLTALEAFSVQARDEWIRGLPRDPDCWDCSKYSDYPARTDLDAAINLH